MKQLLWTHCLSVWVHAGSCFIQKRSSCSSPTSLAFDCTIFARLTTKRMAMKRRIKSSKMMEKPRGRQMNHPQQMWAERKVCIAVSAFIQPPPLLLFVCFDLMYFQSRTPLCAVGKYVDGLMAATPCCTMERQRGQNMRWTSFCLSAVPVSSHPGEERTVGHQCDCTELLILSHRLAVRVWRLHMLCR